MNINKNHKNNNRNSNNNRNDNNNINDNNSFKLACPQSLVQIKRMQAIFKQKIQETVKTLTDEQRTSEVSQTNK